MHSISKSSNGTECLLTNIHHFIVSVFFFKYYNKVSSVVIVRLYIIRRVALTASCNASLLEVFAKSSSSLKASVCFTIPSSNTRILKPV